MSEETTRGHMLVEARREHQARLLAGGAYPTRFERTDLSADIRERHGDLGPEEQTDDRVTVAGRLMLHRSFGKLQFGTLRDAGGTIQLYFDAGSAPAEVIDTLSLVDLGDWLGASGTVMTTKRGELSVRVDELTVLRKALRPLPEKWHGLTDVEIRSRQRYLDLIVNEEARAVAVSRARVVTELRKQFEGRGFIEVETPVLLHEATGANAKPFATHHNALGVDMYLRIATELFLKRLVVGGMERVFEVGRIFRNEGIDSTHNPEFTMLEAYQALADYTDIMTLIEGVFEDTALAVTGGTVIQYRDREVSLAGPYPRARLIDLVSERLGERVTLDTSTTDLAAHAGRLGVAVEPGWSSGRIIAEIYEELVEPDIWDPTFVTHQPIEISPLSRRNAEDPRLADRFELVIAGSEYANAFSELNDPDDQRARFVEQAAARAAGDEEAHPIDEDYLLALEYGLPPTGGLGIGVDRLVMLLTDQHHIREVILFPTLRPERSVDEEE